MKNRGFTLVEILGVIVVLSLLAIGTYTVVDGISKRNKEKLYNVQVESILDGAINYATNTRGVPLPTVPTTTSGCVSHNINKDTALTLSSDNVCLLKIYLNAIVKEGILDEEIMNPLKDEQIDIDRSYVTVTYMNYTTYSSDSSNINKDFKNKFSGNIRYQYTEVLVSE